MKKLILGIFLVQLMIIGVWGFTTGGAAGNSVWVDDASGILVKQDTPENTIVSYNELVSKGSFESAWKLCTDSSKEVISAAMLQELTERTGMETAKVAKIFPANAKGNYAVVGFIRTNVFEDDVEMPILAMSVLKKTGTKWEIVKQLDELDLPDVKGIFEITLDLGKKIEADPFKEFSPEQQEQIANQVSMVMQYVQGAMEEITAMMEEGSQEPTEQETVEENKEAPKSSH